MATEIHHEDPATDAHGEVLAHGEADQGEHGGGHEGGHIPELENFWNVLAQSPLNEDGTATHQVIKHFDPYVEDPQAAQINKMHQNVFFSILAMCIVWMLLWRGMRKRAMIPGRFQSAVELVVSGLSDFFTGIMGEAHAKRYRTFLISLFLFVLAHNWLGLVPFMKSPTNMFEFNIILGLSVFVYVQYTGMRYNGPKKYLLHLMGNPKDTIGWCMTPLMLPLEIMGELIKPLSLSLRLFGNILGEDILLGVFVMLGIMVVSAVGIEHTLIGVPLHFPFLFLALLTSTIQALIFSVLSCIYILLMLPHDEEAH